MSAATVTCGAIACVCGVPGTTLETRPSKFMFEGMLLLTSAAQLPPVQRILLVAERLTELMLTDSVAAQPWAGLPAMVAITNMHEMPMGCSNYLKFICQVSTTECCNWAAYVHDGNGTAAAWLGVLCKLTNTKAFAQTLCDLPQRDERH